MTVVTSITETRVPPSRGAPSCPDLLRVASPQHPPPPGTPPFLTYMFVHLLYK